ncbi:MAG: hypothetical protein ACLP1D_13605 [Xanthobacteraceae bacterium]
MAAAGSGWFADSAMVPPQGANYSSSINESVGTSDAVVRAVSAARGISEAVSASDTVVRSAAFLRTISESVSVSDAIAQVFKAFRSISESIATPSDSVSKSSTGQFTPFGINAPGVTCLVVPSISVVCEVVPSISVVCKIVGTASNS